MEYDDSERATAVAERTRAFVSEVLVDVERELRSETELPRDRLVDLHDRAREYDVFGPGVPEEYGGLGLTFREQVPVIEALGRTRIGPAAVHAPPWPDEAGLYALQLAATDDQRERWLRPLAEGRLRSALSMTEPIQGGGSDPTMIRTTAEREGDEWVLDGHKWWVTGGSDADVVLVFARTDPEAPIHDAISCLVVPTDAPGLELHRDIAHMSDHVAGEPVHSEMTFDGVRVPAGNLLGEPNEGFAFFQRVLAHSRVWLGIEKTGTAARALDVAKAYAAEREAFDEPLSAKQALRFEVADAETDLHVVRLMARDVARKITEGADPRTEVAMFKYRAANAVQDVVDRAVQACGANGIGGDLPLSDFYTNVRAYRIYDGADAVHREVVARDAFEDVDPGTIDDVSRFGEPNTHPRE
ncbi:MAG: acyl-CoA dehydrogenase family protein [Haloarculaceae archaeon]